MVKLGTAGRVNIAYQIARLFDTELPGRATRKQCRLLERSPQTGYSMSNGRKI
jgi:hypothetical protein